MSTEHKMERRRGGQNESGWIQPYCSCGWEGKKHYAYNDYQHSMVKDEENEHKVEAHRAKNARPTL